MPANVEGKKVLIVEDSIDLRELFTRALQAESYSVVTADDGAQALHALDAGLRPDVILFDLNMPEMDGDTFLSNLRKHPDCSHVNAVVVSGIDGLAAKAKDMGANGFLRKPVDLSSLYREVARHI